jgi:hypothetical protein
MAHMYVHHISITIHFILPTLLQFSWAGWVSSTRSVHYKRYLLELHFPQGMEMKYQTLSGVSVTLHFILAFKYKELN